MLLSQHESFGHALETLHPETLDEGVPDNEEIKSRCEIIRSGWTYHESLQRISRARYFHRWLLRQTGECPIAR